MAHERFEIWEDNTSTVFPQWPWRAEMVNYVARFETREKAERYVDSVKSQINMEKGLK